MKSALLMIIFMTGLAGTLLATQDFTDPQRKLELPECDIFLFELSESENELKVSGGINITNRPGYDNQPWFTPEGKSILFSANRDPHRTDIYEYFVASGETKQVTDSPDQEYSPQVSPDNQTLSFVTDGETANQSVWTKDRGQSKIHWLLGNQSEREPVGYYSWNHKTGYILYWSRYGFSIRLVHQDRELSHYVTGDAIPTTPHIIPGSDCFSFMHQQGNGEVWIKELNPETLAVRPLTAVLGNNRNYGWTPLGKILMCKDTQLHRWSQDTRKWEFVVDLASMGVKDVTRVAISPNGKHLAVVGLPSE